MAGNGRIEEGSEATFECEIDGMHFIADLSHLESERGEALEEAQVNSSAATIFGKPTLSFTFGVGRIPFSDNWPSRVIRIGLPA